MTPFNYQFLKDFMAVPMFILIALDPYIHNSMSLLALFSKKSRRKSSKALGHFSGIFGQFLEKISPKVL